MIDAARVLRPLNEARPAIDRLYDYRDPDQLAAAIEEVTGAVVESLRLLLRSDPRAPEDLRLRALSETQLPASTLVETLRAHELISLELAGELHDLERARERIASGDVRAADADRATRVVERLRAEVSARVEPGPGERADELEEEAEPENHGAGIEPVPIPPRAALLVGLGLVAFVALVAYLVFGREDPFEVGVAAFDAGRMGVAEQQFGEVLEDDPEDVTTLLYLARILRRQERWDQARGRLETAVRLAPGDADVRRELGHLFFDLGRFDFAAEQYQRAVEIEPAENTNWIALVLALRAAGDPRAAEVWRSAPADARASLGVPDTTTDGDQPDGG
ncbi:MAG: tetratricopeptide repeat protein [Longimicrobiales bacterium]